MYDRRAFITFLGKASLGAAIIPPFLTSCGNTTTPSESSKSIGKSDLERLKKLVLEGMSPSDQDDLLLANGLDYHTIIKWGEQISDEDTFGFNNDHHSGCFHLME